MLKFRACVTITRGRARLSGWSEITDPINEVGGAPSHPDIPPVDECKAYAGFVRTRIRNCRTKVRDKFEITHRNIVVIFHLSVLCILPAFPGVAG